MRIQWAPNCSPLICWAPQTVRSISGTLMPMRFILVDATQTSKSLLMGQLYKDVGWHALIDVENLSCQHTMHKNTDQRTRQSKLTNRFYLGRSQVINSVHSSLLSNTISSFSPSGFNALLLRIFLARSTLRFCVGLRGVTSSCQSTNPGTS